MPNALDDPNLSIKKKAKMQRENDKWEVHFTRQRRIKVRSRATLIICPLSTVANWEDQFREHWAGEVKVVGGAGTCQTTSSQSQQAGPSSQGCSMSDDSGSTSPMKDAKAGSARPLRVYVYHGNARRPDPAFLADFDAVITTYSTLATEYSKQTRSIAALDVDDDDAGSNGGDDGELDWNGVGGISTPTPEQFMEVDESGNRIIMLPRSKEKKALSGRKRPYPPAHVKLPVPCRVSAGSGSFSTRLSECLIAYS